MSTARNLNDQENKKNQHSTHAVLELVFQTEKQKFTLRPVFAELPTAWLHKITDSLTLKEIMVLKRLNKNISQKIVTYLTHQGRSRIKEFYESLLTQANIEEIEQRALSIRNRLESPCCRAYTNCSNWEASWQTALVGGGLGFTIAIASYTTTAGGEMDVGRYIGALIGGIVTGALLGYLAPYFIKRCMKKCEKELTTRMNVTKGQLAYGIASLVDLSPNETLDKILNKEGSVSVEVKEQLPTFRATSPAALFAQDNPESASLTVRLLTQDRSSLSDSTTKIELSVIKR